MHSEQSKFDKDASVPLKPGIVCRGCKKQIAGIARVEYSDGTEVNYRHLDETPPCILRASHKIAEEWYREEVAAPPEAA